MATNNAVNTNLSGQTGTGAFAGSTSPTFTTPILGAASATSVNFGGSSLSNYTSITPWSPVFTFATPGDLSVVYSTQNGYQTRVGSMITASFFLSCTPTFTTASGKLNITGLTVSSSSSSGYAAVGNILTSSFAFPAGRTSPFCTLFSGTTVITCGASGSGVSNGDITATEFISGNGILLIGTITYQV